MNTNRNSQTTSTKYWHFVDVVWLFLFVFIYWWGAGVIAAH
jgi:heme/copper-type cytochrome/quinol oxidase subunit 3